MDRDRVLADAERLILAHMAGVEHTRWLLPKPGAPEETRPGGWVIIGRLQIWNALGILTRLVAINEETGERRIVDRWAPDQPYERRCETTEERRAENQRYDEAKRQAARALTALNAEARSS